MREIKFRAWDKKNKGWLLGYNYKNLGGFSIVGECVLLGEYAALFHPLTRINEIEIMQYTGLKDKNGKESYFDDLVKWGKSTYQVVWDSDEGVAWLRKVDGEGVWSKLRIHLIKQGEIIGNIHETN